MENKKSNCSVSDKAEMLVFSCSGASDLGEITDKLARRFRDRDIRSMKCLSMVAIDSKPLIDGLKTANILVIDGCSVDCAKKIIDKAGIQNYAYVRLTDLGYTKGKTPATDETIEHIFQNIQGIN